MATAYNPVGSYSSVQTLGPNAAQNVEVVTIQTIPSNVIATIPVVKAEFDDGTAGPLLTSFAENIEEIMGQGKAISGAPKSELDNSGLTEYYVTFTVAYNATGIPTNSLTADVDVPIGLLSSSDALIGRTLVGEAETLIDETYTNLEKMAAG